MPVWNDKMVGHQAASGEVSVNSAFAWSLLLRNAYQFCSSNVWVLQHHPVHAVDMSTVIVSLCIWGCSLNQISLAETTLCHTSCIHKGLHAGTWPDLLTCWPPNQMSSVHWDTTGQATQEPHWLMRSPSGLPVATQSSLHSIGRHRRTTGATSTLGCHWYHTGWY